MNIVIVGATGAVGREMIECLKDFPLDKLRLVASSRSVGKKIGELVCEEISEKIFEESDIALFSAGSELSKEWRERVVAADCLMIDNSSAFRYDDDVPLVVPEINASAARNHKGVIANPNCTTAIAAVVLWPLHKAFALKKVIISTYQATSGAGAAGMNELLDQTEIALNGGEASCEVFDHAIPFNVIPHIDKFQENGYTKEEMKVAWETAKIFGTEIPLSCTAVRIPTLRAHCESIVIECEKVVSVEAAKEVLEAAEGVKLVELPMPINATGEYDVEVGRIRRNLVFGENGLEFFLCGDQLLKGAALNAVQIA
ncbi:aspartate-semialdehyde dehydrogenase, partial [Candidatus Gracilibacteria bacterium]|nr:aspartate-semialdehyde dehydrogenase [Candidatus Gracilibacteria bacterium]